MLSVVQLDLKTTSPRVSKTAGVLICDQHGNPLVTVIEHQPGVETITTFNDPDFKRQLEMLGLGHLNVEGVKTTKIANPPVPSNYQLLGANS